MAGRFGFGGADTRVRSFLPSRVRDLVLGGVRDSSRLAAASHRLSAGRRKHGDGRSLARGRAAIRESGVAFLRLDRAGGYIRLFPEVFPSRGDDPVASA